ncbi:hypothetical protein PCASD_19038 [Puccinia coronata f. sp. avenae]|uniref:Uncharacterized protein n=1 Tax=Puccinia coronata f. sp. avenae TaxID=200324 RepID=A0A2N5TWR2_9BASI|nr:hypothetical protein PCASD_19038 [Puccinia coronata f. sp. avenae]
MKHVKIQLHFIWEVIANSKICLQYTCTSDMLADFLTIAVPRPALLSSLLKLKSAYLGCKKSDSNSRPKLSLPST